MYVYMYVYIYIYIYLEKTGRRRTDNNANACKLGACERASSRRASDCLVPTPAAAPAVPNPNTGAPPLPLFFFTHFFLRGRPEVVVHSTIIWPHYL